MSLDIFRDDAFSVTKLTETIIGMPYAPTRIAQLGWFQTEGIDTTSIAVESKDGVLTLVPAKDRGAPGTPKTDQLGKLRDFRAIHLPQRCAVMADEVQNVRAFGSMTAVDQVLAKLKRKIQVCLDDLAVTMEHQRIGAVKGIIMDADGTTPLLNLFTEFGVSQQTYDMNLDNDATDLIAGVTAVKRLVEDALGRIVYRAIRVLCSPGFFDAFVSHPAVVESFRRYSESSFLRSDNRSGFEWGSASGVPVIWEEYRGGVGSTMFIEADCAYAVPEGVPGLFHTKFAPANYVETVNTPGLPFYAKQQRMEFDKGIDCEVQSNPIHYCQRPRAIIKLTKT